MNYRKGQVVRVKQGVLCPDSPEFDLSGWQGRIFEPCEDDEPEPTIGIAWDSVTLRNMPEKFIVDCERERLSWAEMYLGVDEVEPAKSRDSERDVRRAQSELEARFGWLSMGAEGERIQAVVNSAKSYDDWKVMEAWGAHLEETLEFPFDGVVDESFETPLEQGDRITIMRVEVVDDHYGIIVACKRGHERYDVPLADIAVRDLNSPNAQHVEDYRTWFANR